MPSDLRRSQAVAQAAKNRQLAPTNQLGKRTAVEIESRLLVIDDEQIGAWTHGSAAEASSGLASHMTSAPAGQSACAATIVSAAASVLVPK